MADADADALLWKTWQVVVCFSRFSHCQTGHYPTVSCSVFQHPTPVVTISHSFLLLICFHCTAVFPSFSFIFPTILPLLSNSFSLFLHFLYLSSFSSIFSLHNFILQIPIELCRSRSRNMSRLLEGLFYCIPSFSLYVFVSPSVLLPLLHQSLHESKPVMAIWLPQAVVIVAGHWHQLQTQSFTVYTNTTQHTQHTHKYSPICQWKYLPCWRW